MSVKKISLSLNKKELVQKVSNKLKKHGSGNIAVERLTEIFNLFIEEMVKGLKDDKSINFRGDFSLSTWMSKPVVKNNPSPNGTGEKFVIPSQRRVRFRISENWKAILNPLISVTQSLRKSKNKEELDKIYKKSIDIYQKDKDSSKRINDIYKSRLKTLSMTKK